MSDCTVEKRYQDIHELMRDIREEQPMAQPGDAWPATLLGAPAPEEQRGKLLDFERRTQNLIGGAAYSALPLCPDVSQLRWGDYHPRLSVLQEALTKECREIDKQG